LFGDGLLTICATFHGVSESDCTDLLCRWHPREERIDSA